ncbi:MAG: hypothetical protein KJ601_00170, partial [Nanoarchaeota archaeon]|nr:hypothetical protein [Nanoarchaeota archaeon]
STVQKAIDKGKTIKSISYTFQSLDNGVTTIRSAFVKGDKMKLKKSVEGAYGVIPKGKEHDTIYIDMTAKTAIGYCEDNKICTRSDAPIALDYEKEVVLDPLTLLDQIESAEKIATEQLDSRNVVKFSSEIGTAWIDTYYGVIMRVEEGASIIRFENWEVNQVKDDEVVR